MELLSRLARRIDRTNRRIGEFVAWTALAMVVVQFAVVILRYVFGIGFIWMQESVIYLHGLLFMAGAAYTLLEDGHVRVDIWYREADAETRARVDLAGAVFFLLPVCAVIWAFAWPYVGRSWAVFEGSQETSGIQAVFLYKTLILAFAGLVGLQGVSMAVAAWRVLAGEDRDT